MDGLTVGRIVHHVDTDGLHRAAIVVHVWSKEHGVVNLQVFNNGIFGERHPPEGTFLQTSVQFSEVPEPNRWHWIEKA